MAPYKPIAADVIGTYRANTSPAHWYLILEKNGVYEQLFYPSTKVAIKNSGHWTLDCDIGDGNCSIGLDNAIVDEDNASMGSERGHWNIDVGRAFFGGPVLVIDDDQDLYLEKID